MTDSFSIAVIKWDQKLGGVVEFSYPKIKITPNTAMNLYNMHRMHQSDPSFGTIYIKLEGGDSFNAATFFTGYGQSTSPDGFTGNYGKNTIGVAERVICLFFPSKIRAEHYDEVIAKVTSRIVLSVDAMDSRIKILSNLLKNSPSLTDSSALYEFLTKRIDHELNLTPEEIATANSYEVKALHYILADKNDHIKELTINPAKTAFCEDEQKLARAEEQKKQIQALITQVTMLSTEKELREMQDNEKDEIIAQLKQDYIKIFGTLTDQIQQLEAEINGITESTQGLVQDLNKVLAEKINRINELEKQIKQQTMNE